jgi:hypothetical protein
LRRYNAESKRLETLGRVPVIRYAEVGMMGLALSGLDGEGKRRLFLMHCPEVSEDHVLRVTGPAGQDPEDQADGKGGYSIPSGNLFPEGKGCRAETFAMGVCNGFRLSFDPEAPRNESPGNTGA